MFRVIAPICIADRFAWLPAKAKIYRMKFIGANKPLGARVKAGENQKVRRELVELRGIEPLTSSLRTRRSPI
jgi:hypothetical protein